MTNAEKFFKGLYFKYGVHRACFFKDEQKIRYLMNTDGLQIAFIELITDVEVVYVANVFDQEIRGVIPFDDMIFYP